MNIQNIKTLGELKASGYQRKGIKEELRQNLIRKLKQKENKFLFFWAWKDQINKGRMVFLAQSYLLSK